VRELAALATELGADFSAYAAGLDADPQRLAELEARRAVLTALMRKYADGPEPDLAGVAEWSARAAARLAEIDVSDEALAALAARRDEAAAVVADLAADLSKRRAAAAAELGAAVTAELSGLAMAGASCTIVVRPRAVVAGSPTLEVDGIDRSVGPDGADDVEIVLQSHADAPALPLARGASGGELSRVMLALEVCLAGADPVPTMVFDEVDAGVGGRAAVEVGRRLARLARSARRPQVIVVTHLAQVAAYADTHVVVDKRADGGAGVTASDVRVVTGDDRVSELARMLSGTVSETARQHARELLDEANADGADPPARARRKPVKARR
jgi:DNA repair protein RecN (Recombination protein N)